ncbi:MULTISPECIES: pyrroline-5-carboxylate reductase [Rhodococcus]|jgi:pyrroline-5-carboxylate reductase|uniref:Pyrroline-5-carboxylate reductase n=1 Tax=Rhodococcus oxybenzonivorans TaxID=1990687 RepID=A0AAE4V1H1_9NOCA|nr:MULTISPECIES: pyrroline-5-carboxylate reductase [Rhodococcus]MDV7240472.1 pyrroline-5-carboxylate reductase [Rhodococcus oxybenzonivorans]MDV7266755.1 pyrroline-5-carboxylate reductase [Rhodococcus oxybenzonivorans]MDV7272745.1 pyrroline-5-carboxylate reductase [Rhodococcus oxybenzonivorans]MDV7333516.1 pyrroline-5-carboxylate reductase [Rhodococcus oxybenzonivorans]MDV7342683.1 pyrroline-5-carboxylate reductase [Rhodococcus oxybenzonivorans]
MTRIAVIGGGRIGEALISGLLQSGHAVKDLVVAEQHPPRAAELAAEYSVCVSSPQDAAEGADVIVVAVKPGDVESALTAVSKADLDGEREQILVSLAAGIPTSYYEKRLPAGFPVVRVMPNTPMLVGEGVSVLAPGRHVKKDHLDLVRGVLSAVGKVVTVPESQIDAVTAVSGSGPAYFFLVAEAMIDAGVGLGLTRATANELVVQTMVGAAAMLDQSGESTTELRAAVTSPGGTTAAAIRQLEKNGLRSAFYDALEAAKSRSAELGTSTE